MKTGLNNDSTENVVTVEERLDRLIQRLNNVHGLLFGPTVAEKLDKDRLPLPDRLQALISDGEGYIEDIENGIRQISEK